VSRAEAVREVRGVAIYRVGIAVVTAVLLGASSVEAQPALLTNGRVDVRAVAGPLDRTFTSAVSEIADAGWIGYAVPVVPGGRFMCDWSEWERTRPAATTVKLEPSNVFFVLYRVETGRVSRIRMFSEGCGLDAGGRTLLWLTGVAARDSIALLRSFADGGDRRLTNGALAALAMHADQSAVEALVSEARSGSASHTRGQALFWLAQRAGDQAVGAIADAIDRDPDTEVKKRAVFALSQLPKDEGVPRLIDVARSHSNPAVRRQAMFWLGQSRDPRAIAFFESVLIGGKE
jgi:hypothetical protein